jgi:hypothetical protein
MVADCLAQPEVICRVRSSRVIPVPNRCNWGANGDWPADLAPVAQVNVVSRLDRQGGCGPECITVTCGT